MLLPSLTHRGIILASCAMLLLLTAACIRKESLVLTPAVATDAIKIEVRQDGIYGITQEALREAGLDFDAWARDDLHLSQGGLAVPYALEGNRLIFSGLASDDRYTPVRTYILQVGMEGLAMREGLATPGGGEDAPSINRTLALEEDLIYTPESLQEGHGDPWLWQTLGQGQLATISFSLTGVAEAAARLRLRLWGVTHNPQVINDHDFDVLLNERRVGTVRWEGQTAHIADVTIPPGVLKDGENRLTLDNEVAGAAFLDIMELDWIELNYDGRPEAVDDRLIYQSSGEGVQLSGFTGQPLLFDVTDRQQPVLLAGWLQENEGIALQVGENVTVAAVGPQGFLAPARIAPLRRSEWREPSNQADLIILTTADLASELAPLVEERENQGIRTTVVDAEEVYDAFGFGAATPASIQEFVRYAYERWSAPHPRYLLIVGEATYDYRDNLSLAPPNAIPSPMVPVAYGGETVSDARLADVDGDLKPELAVGRWPVSNAAQVRDLVRRTLAYEQGEAVPQAIFAVDGSESQFASMANRVASGGSLPATDTQIMVGADAKGVATAWNNGAWLVTYIGHGSVGQWGKNGIFTEEAIAGIRPANPPIVLQMTCLTGLFAHPRLTSLSEAMLLDARGPVLVVAATSLTLSAHQEPFGLGIVQQLQNRENERFGDAFQQAKRELDVAGSDGLREISDTYLLLGDPSAQIVRP